MAILSRGDDTRAEEARPAHCFAAKSIQPGRSFYIDPARGRDDGDGSQDRPWRSLSRVLSNGLVGDRTFRPTLAHRALSRLSRDWGHPPLHDNRQAVVRGGDTVFLMQGNHGPLEIYGIANHAPVTIAALPGAKAVVSKISVARARNFTIRNLVVEPADGSERPYAVTTRPTPDTPQSYDIRFSGLEVRGPIPIADTSPDVWAKHAGSGVQLFGTCVSLEDSTITDVRYGARVYQSDRATVARNTIRGFSVDGIDFSGNDLLVTDNVITDHRLLDADLHPDCIQGQVGRPDETYRRVRVTGNVCLSDTGRPRSQDLQGINIFDGEWHDLTVTCNFVRPSIYHGITLMGVDGAVIERNIVQGWTADKTPWIAMFASKEGRQPTDTVIRHNRATAYLNAIHGGPADPDELISEIRLGSDDKKFRELLRQPVSGVTVHDNVWMHPGPDLSHDKRFVQPGARAVEGPLSVAEAKAALRRLCPPYGNQAGAAL